MDVTRNSSIAWSILFLAGFFEVGWAIGLKYTHGFTRLGPSALTLAAMTVSIGLLAVAVRALPIGTAYAVWTGIGAVGTATLGVLLLGESTNPFRVACLAFIILGIIGLKLAEG
ncbi:MAG: putative multidrug resistance protein [Candidatus Hydrogenedentota bacterium]